MSSLTLFTADPPPSVPEGVCPMAITCGLNFVSQLRSAHIAFEEHEGPLSIKCSFHGREYYEIERAKMAVDDSSYLVLNDGRRYASHVRSDRSVESFCLWFRPNFAENLLRSLITPDDAMLDDPSPTGRLPVSFFERLTPHDDLVSPVLFHIRKAVSDGPVTTGWLEDHMELALERLLHAHRNIYYDVERLPAARFSTRVELFRRLHRAKDFLDASLDTPVSLADAAAIACLSPHHFLRTFKKVFNETPHQYLGRKRMERARTLVLSTETPITRICYDLGFESLGSFSWLFRRTYGVSPIQLRNGPPSAPVVAARDSGPVLYD